MHAALKTLESIYNRTGDEPLVNANNANSNKNTALSSSSTLPFGCCPTSAMTPSERAQYLMYEKEKADKLATLSPYRQSEFRCVECLAALRCNLHQIEELEQTMPHLTTSTKEIGQELTTTRQAARRNYQNLQRLFVLACQHSESEGSSTEPDFALLREHVEKVKKWYREVFHQSIISSLDDPMLLSSSAQQGAAFRSVTQSKRSLTSNLASYSDRRNGNEERVPLLQFTNSQSSSPHINRETRKANVQRREEEDEEFDEFMKHVAHNDAMVDAALDRILAGVGRLRENAETIHDELDTHAVLLNETEQHVAHNTQELQSANLRLRNALREVRSSDVCTYILCLFTLVCVLCLLLRMVM